MQKKIIIYSFDNSEISSNKIIRYLNEMKGELKNQNLPVNDLDIIDGNLKFPETKLFLEQSFKKEDENNAIDCDEVRSIIYDITTPFCEFFQVKKQKKRLSQNKEEPFRDKMEAIHKKNFLSISISEIGQFWKIREEYNFPDYFEDDFFYTVAKLFHKSVDGDILLLVDRKFKRIVGENVVPGAHGVRIIGNRGNGVVLLIKGYKTIIWHEVAHLLGAKDHYNSKSDNHEAIQNCLNPENCVMQWNPGDSFCEKCIDEIKKYLI